MNINYKLSKRYTDLRKAYYKACKLLENETTGKIEVVKKGDSYKYYHSESRKSGEEHHRVYLNSSKLDIARQILEQDYARKFVKEAEGELKVLEKELEYLEGDNAFNCHERLHPGRKKLVKPFLMSEDEVVEEWLSQRSGVKNNYPYSSEIYSENGEHVRSKTEKILADKLKLETVPYKYEEALKLGNRILFPDFTILRKSTMEIIYWEHFGMIDDPKYYQDMIEKLDLYAAYGIVPGKNLIITFETKNNPVSMKLIDSIVANLK